MGRNDEFASGRISLSDLTFQTKPYKGGHKVVASHPAHGTVGFFVVGGDGTVGNIHVHPDLRRQGVATAMSREAEKAHGGPLKHSPYRTEAGEEWAKSYGGDLPPKEELL